ncbi:MAG: zinc metallopeptidase [Clostridiales bacterium]|nr:zinc metallopeptidase [Clostridiales bacterium]
MGFWEIMSTYGLLISIIMMIISLIISANCKHSFNKYSKVMASNGLTGAEAAQRILSAYGVHDVTIQHISGNLTDNYNPKDKTLNLSDSVIASNSIAAIGVAAHECGHAIQHNVGFVPNKIRAALVPGANIGSRFGPYLAIIGIMMMGYLDSDAADNSIGSTIFFVGIVLFALAVLFYLVTLPVELDASRRAMKILERDGLLAGSELSGARAVLSAAAMTYVAAAASAIVTLLRLISYGKRRS